MAVQTRKEITLGEGTNSVAEFRGPTSKENPILVGEEITGNYLGNFKAGKYKSLVHKIELDNGTVIGINGSGQLNKKLEKIALGTNITVVYEGKDEIKAGDWKGSDAHNYRVFDNSGATGL